MALVYRTYSFEKLDAWQLARALKDYIFRATQGFPNSERYGLTSQIRRSMGSVTTNLAEGSGRASSIDKAHFTKIAYSSAIETIDHLITANDLSFIGDKE